MSSPIDPIQKKSDKVIVFLILVSWDKKMAAKLSMIAKKAYKPSIIGLLGGGNKTCQQIPEITPRTGMKSLVFTVLIIALRTIFEAPGPYL